MPSPAASTLYICARWRASLLPPSHVRPCVRPFAITVTQQRQEDDHEQHTKEYVDRRVDNSAEDKFPSTTVDQDEGAMTRRFRSMTEEALESDPSGAYRTVASAGFSEDLKRQLEERIASAQFRTEHRSAFTEIEISSKAGRGTRDIAMAHPWMGEESLHDVSLRMLDDAHKPLRVLKGRPNISGPSAPLPKHVDTGRRATQGTGVRLANARDRSGLYSSLKDSDMDSREREKRFQELKDRFSPGARSVVPGTIQGLASLANQRIEDAIARGQFKNLPSRGKKMERDYNASNPFLDTTEYFLNKMIQKQEIVPPWIEKQQELVSAATKFRTRVRLDWKRHAARMIASAGGTLQDQIRRAEAYAKAELIENPTRKKDETLNTVDNVGHISQISLSGELTVPKECVTSEPEPTPTEEITIGETCLNPSPSNSDVSTLTAPLSSPAFIPPAPHPYRDPAWEATEHTFLTLTVANINSLTRSYNLQAPELAKKPYLSLARELKACYADVAPLLAVEIRDRALGSKKTANVTFVGGGGDRKGVFEEMIGTKVKVRDENEGKRYGFKQLWRDVLGGQ